MTEAVELILPNGETLAVRDKRHELRDPRAATTATTWQSPTQPQIEPWDAEQAWRLGVAANVIAYRCVQLRARAAASVPLVAGRRMGDTSTINEKAPIARLLGPPPGGPAPKLSATKLFRWTHAQKIVTGRRAWEIETDSRGVPVAFWPLASAHLRAFPSKSGTEWFRLFEFGPAHDPVRLKPEDVFYGWEPSGTNFREAESELQSARYDLSMVQLSDRHSLGFLRNSAVPAAIITTTQFPSEAARRKFLQNWSADFQGPDNAGRVALNEVSDDGEGPVADSIDVKVLGLSAKDARLVEQRRDLMAEVAISLGTPWSKLDASGRTFSNADAEDRDWWENTILPDLIDLQDDINMQLAPRLGGDVVWFDLRNVRALKRQLFAPHLDLPALLDRGAIVPNEIRADAGLSPLPGGDVPIVPLATQTATQAAAPMARAVEAVEARMLALETRSVETPPEPEHEDRTADPELVEQRRTRIWQASNAVVTGLESRWQRSWRRMFARQEAATLDRLTGKRGRQAFAKRDAAVPLDAESVFTREFWTAEAEQLALYLYEETVGAGTARLSHSFGVSFDLSAPWVSDFIGARANKLAGQVTQTTYEAIQQAMTDGVQAGEGIDDIARRIRGVFAEASTQRATVIARTEVISAYNGAAVLGAAQMPSDVVAAQEWIATRDGRTRSAHSGADGQVVAIGTAFDVGGDSLAYPGDPNGKAKNTVQCRCTVAFLTSDEFDAAVAGRGAGKVESRAAKVALAMVAKGEFDETAFRRALRGAAA